MTNSFPMQLVLASNQANLMAINAIAQGMLNAAERVAVLNIETSRAATEYAANGLRKFQGSDSNSMTSLQGDELPSPAEATVAYFRSVQDISSAVQGEVTKVISARTGEATDAMVAILDDLERSSPESVVAVVATTVKSAVSSARSAYDSLLKTGLQVVESNAVNVANPATANRKTPPTAKERKSA